MHSGQRLYLTSRMTQIGRIILVFSALLLYKTGWGQGGLPPIVLKDRSTERPIEKVHLRDPSSHMIWISDQEGKVFLDGVRFPVKLIASHVAFQELQIELTGHEFENGSFVILLDPRMVMLDPIEITTPGPQIVHQPADLHVGAYHINDDGVWVLVYERSQLWHREQNAGEQVLRGARLHLLDTLFRQIASAYFESDVKALHHDHLQRTIVETRSDAYVAERYTDRIKLTRIDLPALRSLLQWKAAIAGHLIGSDQEESYPAFSYIALDTITLETRSICTVEDRHLMQLFRSQYKYMSGREKVIAMDMELETGIDREIIAGYMTGFHKDLYYREPYAPLFVVNDTICIFDHTIHRIRRFDRLLRPIDEVPITYHDQRSWRSRLIQDPITQRIYSIHQRNDRIWLNEIAPNTGTVKSTSTLHHPFPEEIQVHDGYVWYVYRPFGSLQRRTLYRELLRGSTPPGS